MRQVEILNPCGRHPNDSKLVTEEHHEQGAVTCNDTAERLQG